MQIDIYKNKIINIIDNKISFEEKLQAICDYLEREISYYDWVGFYFNNNNKPELKLAQFTGEPTEHVIIPFGKGICGQVAVSNEKLIIQDVNEEDNYISCGWKVKSEMVVPIFVDGQNVGQIDIDSHTVNPFTQNDTELLEFVCQEVAKHIKLPVT